jgi:hypothetical protein
MSACHRKLMPLEKQQVSNRPMNKHSGKQSGSKLFGATASIQAAAAARPISS